MEMISRLKSVKTVSFLFLSCYWFMVMFRIVFLREAYKEYHCKMRPFWSYGVSGGVWENMLNVTLFIPIGFLLCLCCKKQSWWITALIGCILSVVIELFQLILRKGFCEFDDVFHNTLGCIIGLVLFRLIRGDYYKV